MGFENIAMNSGWSQALVGATTVMTGLVILSLAISQIHKLVDFWERRTRDTEPPASDAGAVAGAPDDEVSPPQRCPADINETDAIYQPLVDQLGSTFELKALYQRAAQYDFPHPHITIRCLREAGILTAEGEGLFRWNR